MIINTEEMVIKSDDGKMVLNTISSVSITKGANIPREESTYTQGQTYMEKNAIARLTEITSARRTPLACLGNIVSPDVKNENHEINIFPPSYARVTSPRKMFFVFALILKTIDRESKKSKKLFNSKFYLLKDKVKIRKIKDKLKRHIHKDMRLNSNKIIQIVKGYQTDGK